MHQVRLIPSADQAPSFARSTTLLPIVAGNVYPCTLGKDRELSRAFRFEAVRKNILEGWARLCVLRGENERAFALAVD